MLRNTVLLFPSRGHTAASTRPCSSYPVEVSTGDAELEANEDGQGCRLRVRRPHRSAASFGTASIPAFL